MEKENFYSNGGSPPSSSYGATSTSPQTHPTWLSSSLAMDIQVAELNCLSGQLPNSFLNLNWENSLDQSVPFESALSSIVSSPRTSNAATFPSESVVIRELIGRLGSICNSGEISPQSEQLGFNGASFMGGNNSTNNSCYSTPLNSPPKLNLSMIDHQFKGNLPISGNSKSTHPNLVPLSADPGFAERAAKFSCFGSRSFNGLMGEFGLNETEFAYRTMPKIENGKLSRISSSPSLQDGLETEMRSASASGQIPGVDPGLKGSNDINGRKRKTAPRGKANDLSSSSSIKDVKMVIEDEDSNAKRCKPDEDAVKEKMEANGNVNTAKDQKQNKDNQKPPEPPKDYIHVRARRGQATDSHSLAERVRREKISERMKFLQDLVPGCNKVTGKAVMLDEIINYVQSLQRQVEFLSMKLATVNPKLDFNMETLLSKTNEASIHTIYPLDASASAFPYGNQLQQGPPLESSISNVNSLDSILHRSLSMQFPPTDGFGEAASQLATFWENDLQSIVQMGFNQNQNPETEFQPQSFLGSLATTHMKIEL